MFIPVLRPAVHCIGFECCLFRCQTFSYTTWFCLCSGMKPILASLVTYHWVMTPECKSTLKFHVIYLRWKSALWWLDHRHEYSCVIINPFLKQSMRRSYLFSFLPVTHSHSTVWLSNFCSVVLSPAVSASFIFLPIKQWYSISSTFLFSWL